GPRGAGEGEGERGCDDDEGEGHATRHWSFHPFKSGSPNLRPNGRTGLRPGRREAAPDRRSVPRLEAGRATAPAERQAEPDQDEPEERRHPDGQPREGQLTARRRPGERAEDAAGRRRLPAARPSAE